MELFFFNYLICILNNGIKVGVCEKLMFMFFKFCGIVVIDLKIYELRLILFSV